MPVRDRSAPMLLVKLRVADRGSEFRVVTDKVLSFKYTDRERKADLCKLTIDNSDLSNFDDPVWRKGGILIVSWGYPAAMSPAREVVITAVKGFRTLDVEAEARSVELNRVVRTRSFENVTVADVARTIASDAGFGPDQQQVDDTGEVLPVVTQARLTDAQFLRRWASRLGFEFFVDFDGLHFHPRRLGERPVRVIRYFTDPGLGDVLEDPSVENDVTARPGRVRVRGRDPMTRQDIDVQADNDTDADRDTLAPVIDIIDPETGNARTVERRLGSEDVVPTADATSTQATARARARFRRAQQVAVKMRVPIVGDPLLFAKTVVQVEGMGRRLSIRYYVEEVEHDLSPSGYTCNLRLVSDGHGGHSTESRRAQGLSLLEAAPRGGGSGQGSSQEVLQRLQAAHEAATGEGDTQRAEAIRTVILAYQRGGNQSRTQVDAALRTLSQDPGSSDEVRRETAAARAALAQRGAETEAGGRPNRQDAQEDRDALEPYDAVDPETGDSVTRFRQTPGRG